MQVSLPRAARARFTALLLTALSACSSLEEQYCAVAAQCDDPALLLDPVGSSEDSEAVCVVTQRTAVEILAANSDDICKERLQAERDWMACVVEEGCDAFDATRPACSDVFLARVELAGESRNRCNE